MPTRDLFTLTSKLILFAHSLKMNLGSLSIFPLPAGTSSALSAEGAGESPQEIRGVFAPLFRYACPEYSWTTDISIASCSCSIYSFLKVFMWATFLAPGSYIRMYTTHGYIFSLFTVSMPFQINVFNLSSLKRNFPLFFYFCLLYFFRHLSRPSIR